jgi:hypothetical protein
MSPRTFTRVVGALFVVATVVVILLASSLGSIAWWVSKFALYALLALLLAALMRRFFAKPS